MHVEDRDALHEFLNEIHEANVKWEGKKEAGKFGDEFALLGNS